MRTFQKAWVNLDHRLSELKNYLPGRYIGIGSNVRIFNGKLRPPYNCSIVVTEHCNLSCRDCNHASPVMPPGFPEPADFMPGLRNLAKVYRPRTVNLIGGEPLLRPDLGNLIRTVRRAGMGQHVSLVTNGVLLNRMPESFWDEINALEISVYPKTGVDDARLNDIKRKARRHQVKLLAFGFDTFRTTFSTRGTDDPDLAERIYRTCEIANLWGCHTISGNRLYKCPQAIYAPQIPGCRANHDFREDGIPLASVDKLFDRLHDYFSSDQPLKACGYCLGTVGKLRPHAFVHPSEWATGHADRAEELIDYRLLENKEQGLGRFVEHRKLLFRLNG